MEGILFQWDKACDAMPMLRLASRALCIFLLFVLVFFIIPSIFMPDNLRRPGPLDYGKYDSAQGRYVEGKRAHGEGPHINNIETDRLVNSVENSILTRPDEVGTNVIKKEISGGIDEARNIGLNDQQEWDYQEQVAFIVPVGFEEYQFKIETGMYVDTRNLHKTGEYRQFVTVKAPPGLYGDLHASPMTVTRMRDVKTQCLYYSMHIFGKRRLVLGGSEGKIDVEC